MSKEAMKLALEALEICSVRQEHQWQGLQKMQMAEHALREALAKQPAQQEQESELQSDLAEILRRLDAMEARYGR